MVARARRGKRPDILEQGVIYLTYRRRADARDVHSLRDLERVYVVLAPNGGDRRTAFRIIAIGRKHAPPAPPIPPAPATPSSPPPPPRFWGLVTRVADTPQQAAQELGREEFLTAPLRPCIRRAAVACGSGAYCIARHGDHTHFSHILDDPGAGEPLHRLLGLHADGDYLLTIKNPSPLARRPPHSSSNAPAAPAPTATYPDTLQRLFHHHLLISPETPDFLDFEGTHLFLHTLDGEIDPDAAAELGITLDPQAERAAAAALHAALAAGRAAHPAAPLLPEP